MITEDYVSFETAKLLKERGFKEWCEHCYGVDVRHKGTSISFDEEYELKSAGLEDEIEYVEGGYLYNFGCDNRKEDAKVWAAPTLSLAMKWLRKEHNIHIAVIVAYNHIPRRYEAHIMKLENIDDFILHQQVDFTSYEEACEAAIKYYLENLI